MTKIDFPAKIAEAINAYLKACEDYSVVVVLAIDWQQKEVKVDSPEKLSAAFQQYLIRHYIRVSDKGYPEADVESIGKLCENY